MYCSPYSKFFYCSLLESNDLSTKHQSKYSNDVSTKSHSGCGSIYINFKEEQEIKISLTRAPNSKITDSFHDHDLFKSIIQMLYMQENAKILLFPLPFSQSLSILFFSFSYIFFLLIQLPSSRVERERTSLALWSKNYRLG